MPGNKAPWPAGWAPPPPSDDGVRYAPSESRDPTLSYPEGGFGVLESERPGNYWFDHRAREITALLQRLDVSTLWDVGAGVGTLGARLSEVGLDVVAVEPSPVGAHACARAGLPTMCGRLEDLRLPDACLDAIGLFDVIEHIPDPLPVLVEAHRVLKPNGLVVATVPAMQWLWGDEDDYAGHIRRYRAGTLTSLAATAGFATIDCRYLFSMLVPPALVVRAIPYRLHIRLSSEKVERRLRRQLSTQARGTALIGKALGLESRLSERVRLPFGTSLLAAWRKTHAPATGA
jgi:SAM-dependent methyltransferase